MSLSVRQALDVSQRSVSYRDAEVLLGHILGIRREELFSNPERILTTAENAAYEAALTRREHNEPVAYITGVREFYGRKFACDARALIPRPETEGIIERALDFLPTYFHSHLKQSGKPCPLHILELGTGCGNIAITLALELAAKSIPSTIIATDLSTEALELAKENLYNLAPELSRHIVLKFIQADLFDHQDITRYAPYDLITANLPYVPLTWQRDPAAQADVIFHEPDLALFGGEDGLSIYREFFSKAPNHLHPEGKVLIEYGEDQTSNLLPLVREAFPSRTLEVHKDYANLDRILEIS